MPSCLGIYTDKNIIKYAKITSTAERNHSSYTLDAYGVKFFDNIQTAVDEVAAEIGLEQDSLALALTNEEYFIEEVFSNLNKKDMLELVKADYSEKSGNNFSDAIAESRLKTALNSGSIDKKIAILVMASKGELANIRQNFRMYKIASISPLPISIKNLFVNQGIDEEAAVVNIEDKTTITIFHNSEIQYVTELPVGSDDIINKLSEKYNSVSKAFEALKKVSLYSDEIYEVDDESREILDTLIPIIYDIRQQTEDIITPYLQSIKKIYLTGTGATIGNIDLYFKDVFLDTECEILNPFFVSKASSNINDIIEVNSAVALALDGLGMVDADLNFNEASKKAAGISEVKSFLEKLDLKEKIKRFKSNVVSTVRKINSPAVKKKRNPKRNIDFDSGLIQTDEDTDINKEDELEVGVIGKLDLAFRVLTMIGIVAFTVYASLSIITNKELLAKNSNIKDEIAKANSAVAMANSDASYLNVAAKDYIVIKEKLSALITKISQDTHKTSFDIPNFLSKLMFVMPNEVQVISIDIDSNGNVELDAQSGQYAQLGYLVSRLKLEKIIDNVEMQPSVGDSDIKIKIKGVLP